MQMIDETIEDYVFQLMQAEPDYLQKPFDLSDKEMKYPGMITGRIEMRLLKLIIQLVAADTHPVGQEYFHKPVKTIKEIHIRRLLSI